MSHGVVCKYHYRGKLSLWLTSVTVWLILREGVAKSPCRCGSIAEIYIVCENFSGNPSEIFGCIQHATLHAAQITAPYKFNVFSARVSKNKYENSYLV